MSIEALKEQARRHEQKEEWAKALDLYHKAIQQLDEQEQPDIGLYNRVADIQVRQGQLDKAVVNYEKAIDLYAEAELPNNAIAVCKKVVRNMPMRHSVYLRMGQIRGKQGFFTDARQNFLTYAERMQAEGDIDEGLRALAELADLAPEDVEIRLAIAAQMQGHGRTEDAIAQLQTGYREATQRGLDTGPFEAQLEALGAEPEAADATLAFETTALGGEDAGMGDFGDIVIGEAAEDASETEGTDVPDLTGESALPDESAPTHEDEVEVGAFEIALDGEDERGAVVADGGEEEAEPLPTFGLEEEGVALGTGDEADSEEEAEPLPFLEEPTEGSEDTVELEAADFGERDLGEREGSEYVAEPVELPELDAGVSMDEAAEAREAAFEEGRPGVSEPMGHEALAAEGDLTGAMASLRRLIQNSPDDVALRQRLVEYAFRLKDEGELVSVWLELAETLERTGQGAKARSVYQQVLTVDSANERAREALGQAPAATEGAAREVASSEDYVDLGSLILDDDEGEKTTRFVVAYEEPSGDEQADFAKMLSQFKAKVAENLSSDDVKAHHDLGTAYKEMGLVDEAISEFQQALRASADHLPTYELLGQCFMEKGEYEAAVRTLKRALDAPFEIEDELLAIYYYIGRAYEALGNKDQAVEFYDRVFSLDINFADVTERLRALR